MTHSRCRPASRDGGSRANIGKRAPRIPRRSFISQAARPKPRAYVQRAICDLFLTIKIGKGRRSEEHTSELQSLMRISYAVFCLKKKKNTTAILYYSQHMNQNTIKYNNLIKEN